MGFFWTLGGVCGLGDLSARACRFEVACGFEVMCGTVWGINPTPIPPTSRTENPNPKGGGSSFKCFCQIINIM